MSETDDTPAGEAEHREALALAHALVHASTRDWQAVARGEADRSEVAARRAAAGDSPEAIARAERLFAPYDDLEERRLVDALLSVPQSAPHPQSPQSAPGSPAADRSRRNLLVVASILSLAAALVLVFVAFGADLRGSNQPRAAVAALPAYALEPGDTLTTKRSTPAEGPARYTLAMSFTWTLRPELDIEGPLPLVLGRAIDSEGRAHALPLHGAAAPNGVTKLNGTIASLGLSPGAWTIELVVVRMVGRHVEHQTHALPIVIEP